MKRLIAALILLVFVLTAYFTGYFYISNTCKQANELLEECTAAYNNGKDASEPTEKLDKFWSEKEKPLSVFVNHAAIDEIELAIASLLIYSSTAEDELFFEHSQNIKTLLHQLMEDTVPGVHSIL